MSNNLETLLEAAEFLEKNNNFKNIDGNQSTQPIDTGHLKIDPNLPISFQFHTYSSSVPISTGNEIQLLSNNHRTSNKNSNKYRSTGGRTKSASFSVSNSSFQQSRASIRRLTGSDKTSVSEATTRHRELHKTLEKNRRAHLRSCFNELMNELPKTEYNEKKYSHINIIHYAIKYIHELKRIESVHKDEKDELIKQREEQKNSLINLKEQIINELNQHQTPPSSTNQSSDSSLETLNDDSDNDTKRIFSIRTQEEIDELLLQVEQSLLCASENSSSENAAPFSTYSSQLDNSDDYDDETCSASEGDQEVIDYGNVANSSTILSMS